MYATLGWNLSYAVNHPKIDKQHQGLFKMIEDIPNNLDSKIVNEYIMKLYDYTGTHFAEEEKVLKSIGYPELRNHQKLHVDLVTKLTDFSKNGFANPAALQDFKAFVTNWLVEHILQEDMKYKEYAIENNISW